jgi:hypothetical protein
MREQGMQVVVKQLRQVSRFMMAMNEETTSLFRNLFRLSQLFIQRKISLDQYQVERNNLVTFIRAAVNFQSAQSIKDEMESALSNFPEDSRIAIKRLFAKHHQSKTTASII